MLQQKLAAGQRRIGEDHLNFCFFKIGAGLRDLPALQHGNHLAGLDDLSWQHGKLDDPAAQRRKYLHHFCGVRSHSRRNTQAVDNRLLVDSYGLDDRPCRGRSGRRGRTRAAARGENGKKRGGQSQGERFHGSISVAVAKLSW